jgi:hypothetical protein
MKMISATVKTIVLLTTISLLASPALAKDKIQTGASKGDAKVHKKTFKTPCTDNCEENSTRNLKNK